jgi:hypothetical protein
MRKRTEDSSADLALVAGGGGNEEETVLAIKRLRESQNADVRTIAAQGCVMCPRFDFAWMQNWLNTEADTEVRGWLYVALAVNFGDKSADYLIFRESKLAEMSESEALYLSAGLAIALSSRVYFLKVCQFIFCKNRSVSAEAASLAKMTVSDSQSLEFIDILLDEANKGVK